MSSIWKLSFVSVFCLAAPMVQAQTANTPLQPKQLSGPPEELAQMRAVDPARAAILSKSALLPVEFTQKPGAAAEWRGTLPVENGKLRFLVFSQGNDWQPQLLAPDGKAVAATMLADKATTARFGAEAGYPALQYRMDGVQSGDWNLRLTSTTPGAQRGYVLMEGDDSTQLASYQTHRRQRVGERLGFTAMLSGSVADARAEGGERAVLGAAAGRIQSAQLRVIAPGGGISTWPMYDDGRHGDGAAGDGVYGADFAPAVAGDYVAQVIVRGRDRNGASVVRTAEHVVPVIVSDLRLGGDQVDGVADSGNRLRLGIPVSGTMGGPDHYRVLAEVWGTDVAGRAVPVSWVGGMVAPENGRLSLGFDPRWVARSGARAPFTLRNLRVEDPDHFIPLATAAELPLSLPAARMTIAAATMPINGAIDEAMTMGPRPAQMARTDAGITATGSRLILVHGYCSGGVWPQNQFSNASTFLDAKQNRSHDQFAQRLKAYGASWNSFGTVAHSQGGAAALHLYSYYWSGLDNATGSRLMQSVGTPYQGTNLSGILATVGSWFGVACGSNSDLTYSGASAWLAGIPNSARAKVNYYTTSFKTTNWWTNDYCNAASDLVLSDPEDGTTEQVYGQLPGAVNRGHTVGQCHTAGMRDPAQYLDASRNAVMNSNAAR